MNGIAFTIEAVPVAQPRHRAAIIGGKVHTFEAKREHPIHAFKWLCRKAAKEQWGESPAVGGPLAVVVSFYLPRPKRLKPMLRFVPHTARPDIENLVKGLLDALTGVCWEDDRQVCRLEARKFYTDADMPPRVCVQVRPS